MELKNLWELSLHKGLPAKLKESFPNFEPISRPSVENKKNYKSKLISRLY